MRCKLLKWIPQTVNITIIVSETGKEEIKFNDPLDKLKSLTGLEKRLFTLGADVVRIDRFKGQTWYQAHYKKDSDLAFPDSNKINHNLSYHHDDKVSEFVTWLDWSLNKKA